MALTWRAFCLVSTFTIRACENVVTTMAILDDEESRFFSSRTDLLLRLRRILLRDSNAIFETRHLITAYACWPLRFIVFDGFHYASISITASPCFHQSETSRTPTHSYSATAFCFARHELVQRWVDFYNIYRYRFTIYLILRCLAVLIWEIRHAMIRRRWMASCCFWPIITPRHGTGIEFLGEGFISFARLECRL